MTAPTPHLTRVLDALNLINHRSSGLRFYGIDIPAVRDELAALVNRAESAEADVKALEARCAKLARDYESYVNGTTTVAEKRVTELSEDLTEAWLERDAGRERIKELTAQLASQQAAVNGERDRICDLFGIPRTGKTLYDVLAGIKAQLAARPSLEDAIRQVAEAIKPSPWVLEIQGLGEELRVRPCGGSYDNTSWMDIPSIAALLQPPATETEEEACEPAEPYGDREAEKAEATVCPDCGANTGQKHTADCRLCMPEVKHEAPAAASNDQGYLESSLSGWEQVPVGQRTDPTCQRWNATEKKWEYEKFGYTIMACDPPIRRPIKREFPAAEQATATAGKAYPTRWLALDMSWTTDPNKARRWDREQDAERAKRCYSKNQSADRIDSATVTEHIFLPVDEIPASLTKAYDGLGLHEREAKRVMGHLPTISPKPSPAASAIERLRESRSGGGQTFGHFRDAILELAARPQLELSVAAARMLGVCRICQRKADRRMVLNFGKEFAHQDCLELEKGDTQ